MKEKGRKKYLYFLCALIALPFGFLGGILITDWKAIAPKFYEMTAMGLFQAVTPILSALIISRYISEAVQNSSKRRDIVVEAFNGFRKLVEDNAKLVNEYVSNPSRSLEDKILSMFSETNDKLEDVATIKHHARLTNADVKQYLQKPLFQYKYAVTGGNQFRSKQPVYSTTEKINIHEKYRALIRQINLARCKVFE